MSDGASDAIVFFRRDRRSRVQADFSLAPALVRDEGLDVPDRRRGQGRLERWIS